MSTISSPGIGSGLDVRSLVDELVRAEGEPVVKRLDKREEALKAQLSAMGLLKSELSAFKTSLMEIGSFSSFARRSANSSHSDLFTASALSTATPASYSLEVERLAVGHKLASRGFEDSKASIGTGTISFQFGDPDKPAQSVRIDQNNSSLEGIRDAINSAGIDVTASIIRGDDGFRLVFTAKDTGEANSLRIHVNESPANGSNHDMNGLSQFAFDPEAEVGSGRHMDEMTAAQDAVAYIDGVRVTSATNSLSNSIPGVTINLLKADQGTQATLTVGVDKESATKRVEAFVEGFNKLAMLFKELGGYDAETQQGGILQGDSTLRGIESQMRRMISSVVPGLDGPFRAISDLGIRTQADGSLSLDHERLDRALTENFDEVARIFTAAGQSNDPLLRFSSGSKNTQPGSYEVEVTQLASQARYRDPMAFVSSLLVGPGNDSFRIRVNGVESSLITLNHGEYVDGHALAAELQSKINGNSVLAAAGASIKVEYGDNGFSFISNRYGSASEVMLTSVKDAAASALLGLTVNKSAMIAGQDVQGTIGGKQAKGAGQFLTGSGDAEGLRVEILGTELGKRGTVSYTRGIADQMNRLLEQFLGEESFLEARTNSLDSQLSRIDDERENLIRRMDSLEARYMRQFSALDAMLAEMNSTSNFLAGQLAALPGANTGKK